ncbi:tryptophan synthase subunit alpha [Neisseriaceae bacterium B1]
MSKIAQTFANLGKQKALITYITAGDPSRDETLNIMYALADNGADIIELGVPFSDPMADGPTIQRAVERALAQNVSLKDVLEIVRRFRERNQKTPVVLMGYLNPIHKMGYETFAQAAADAGVDGVLTVDNPIETAAPLQNALKQYNIDSIFLTAPTTTESRMQAITPHAGGFLYYVSLKGVTGSATLDIDAVADKIAVLRQHIQLPIGVGFGISDAQSAQKIAAIADAVIVGSRLVQEIEQNQGKKAQAVGKLVRELKAAVQAA